MNDISILQIEENVIVPIQVELNDLAAEKLQERILTKIEKTGAKGLIIDVSALFIVDSFLARVLVDTAKMAGLMGAETVLVGMKKEVVLTLIRLGLIIRQIKSALTIEEAIALLRKAAGNAHGK